MFKHDNPFVVVIAKPPGQNRSDLLTIRKPLALAQTAKHWKCHERNSSILGNFRGNPRTRLPGLSQAGSSPCHTAPPSRNPDQPRITRICLTAENAKNTKPFFRQD
jgi:hypothetical protein